MKGGEGEKKAWRRENEKRERIEESKKGGKKETIRRDDRSKIGKKRGEGVAITGSFAAPPSG